MAYLIQFKALNHMALGISLSPTHALSSSKPSKVRDEMWREEGTSGVAGSAMPLWELDCGGRSPIADRLWCNISWHAINTTSTYSKSCPLENGRRKITQIRDFIVYVTS